MLIVILLCFLLVGASTIEDSRVIASYKVGSARVIEFVTTSRSHFCILATTSASIDYGDGVAMVCFQNTNLSIGR